MLVALHDPLLVVASLVAVFALVFGARLAGSRGAPAAGLRRTLHALVGLWTVFITTRFERLGWALLPPLIFLALNASGRTGRLAPAISRAGDSSSERGLWTFPLGVALTYVLFWGDSGRWPVLAGCLALALADPAAAWIGSHWGQRRLHPLGSGRTLEGSLAFFLVAALAVGFLASRSLGVIPTFRVAIGCAATGTVAEALSPRGWDNAAIPVVIGAAYHFLA